MRHGRGVDDSRHTYEYDIQAGKFGVRRRTFVGEAGGSKEARAAGRRGVNCLLFCLSFLSFLSYLFFLFCLLSFYVPFPLKFRGIPEPPPPGLDRLQQKASIVDTTGRPRCVSNTPRVCSHWQIASIRMAFLLFTSAPDPASPSARVWPVVVVMEIWTNGLVAWAHPAANWPVFWLR